MRSNRDVPFKAYKFDNPPPPCDKCKAYVLCAKEELVCEDFINYVDTGKPNKPTNPALLREV